MEIEDVLVARITPGRRTASTLLQYPNFQIELLGDRLNGEIGAAERFNFSHRANARRAPRLYRLR